MTELIFIIDRSGSMSGKEADTIGGFNTMLRRQCEAEERTKVSTLLFDHEMLLLHKRLPLEAVPPMTMPDYEPRGTTALLDAVGHTILKYGEKQRRDRPYERPDKTLVVIITDGMENASRVFTYESIHRLIRRQQERYGWEFLFLGANIDAPKEAARMGIRKDRSANFSCDSVCMEDCFEDISDAVLSVRQGKKLQSDWSARTERSYQAGRKNR